MKASRIFEQGDSGLKFKQISGGAGCRFIDSGRVKTGVWRRVDGGGADGIRATASGRNWGPGLEFGVEAGNWSGIK